MCPCCVCIYSIWYGDASKVVKYSWKWHYKPEKSMHFIMMKSVNVSAHKNFFSTFQTTIITQHFQWWCCWQWNVLIITMQVCAEKKMIRTVRVFCVYMTFVWCGSAFSNGFTPKFFAFFPFFHLLRSVLLQRLLPIFQMNIHTNYHCVSTLKPIQATNKIYFDGVGVGKYQVKAELCNQVRGIYIFYLTIFIIYSNKSCDSISSTYNSHMYERRDWLCVFFVLFRFWYCRDSLYMSPFSDAFISKTSTRTASYSDRDTFTVCLTQIRTIFFFGCSHSDRLSWKIYTPQQWFLRSMANIFTVIERAANKILPITSNKLVVQYSKLREAT